MPGCRRLQDTRSQGFQKPDRVIDFALPNTVSASVAFSLVFRFLVHAPPPFSYCSPNACDQHSLSLFLLPNLDPFSAVLSACLLCGLHGFPSPHEESVANFRFLDTYDDSAEHPPPVGDSPSPDFPPSQVLSARCKSPRDLGPRHHHAFSPDLFLQKTRVQKSLALWLLLLSLGPAAGFTMPAFIASKP